MTNNHFFLSTIVVEIVDSLLVFNDSDFSSNSLTKKRLLGMIKDFNFNSIQIFE